VASGCRRVERACPVPALAPRAGVSLDEERALTGGASASSTRGGVVLKGSDKRGLGAAGVCGL